MPETLLNEVLTVAKDKIRNGVQINLECKEGQPVYCDREFMRICLMNLLLNAIQAIEDKGEITIDCRRDNVFSCISVIDTGSGVSPEEMNKIFEPYYSTKKLGIGIGLAITKRFVEEHGGTITIDSEVGKGTTMRMRIPCNEV